MEEVAKSIRGKNKFVFNTELKQRISLECILGFGPYQVFPFTMVLQVFASDKSTEPLPASFLLGGTLS